MTLDGRQVLEHRAAGLALRVAEPEGERNHFQFVFEPITKGAGRIIAHAHKGAHLLIQKGAGPKPEAELSERRYPGQADRALNMWTWCNNRGISIRRLALQFCLAAPLNGNGMLLAGPASPKELDEVLTDATADIDQDLWQEFEKEFDVGLKG